MLEDRYGNQLSTSSATARDAYVKAVDLFLAADPGVEESFQAAITADPDFALAHLGLARNRQVLGQGRLARETLQAARDCSANLSEREAGQINALGLALEGKGPEAYRAVCEQLRSFPRDVMTAQTCMGVFGLIGFSGQPGREAEHLAFTAALASHYGDDWWYLTMLAFAQMEAGQLDPATTTMARAYDANPRNANAAHYYAHLYYETGERDAGYRFLTDWLPHYDRQGLLHCHLNWHAALWALAGNDLETMWRLIDEQVGPEGAWGPSLNVLTDTVAILFRAVLAGVDVPTPRWQRISDYATQSFPRPGLAFADVHAAIAHAMAGNRAALDNVIAGARGPAGDLVVILAEAFAAISEQDWDRATAELTRAMVDHARIGGSRAQRDLIEYAMVELLLKQNRAEEARRLLAIRRPLSSTGHAIFAN